MEMNGKMMRTLLIAAMLSTLLVGFCNGALAQVEESQTAIPGESIQTNGGKVIALSALEHRDDNAEAAVYYTSEIDPEAMVALYDALGTELTGDRIAVKLSTGEPGYRPQSADAAAEKHWTQHPGYRPLVPAGRGALRRLPTVCARGSDDRRLWGKRSLWRADGGYGGRSPLYLRRRNDSPFAGLADGRHEHGQRGSVYDYRTIYENHKSGRP